jgi:hypothetical protein
MGRLPPPAPIYLAYHDGHRGCSRELKFGNNYLNRPSGDSVHAHHADLRHSGNGGEGSKYGIGACFEKRTIYAKYAFEELGHRAGLKQRTSGSRITVTI